MALPSGLGRGPLRINPLRNPFCEDHSIRDWLQFFAQVNKSNAKKHGSPRRNSKSRNCGFPFLSTQTISSSSTVKRVFGIEIRMTVAREQLSAAMLDHRE
jgi:hypothetical protein